MTGFILSSQSGYWPSVSRSWWDPVLPPCLFSVRFLLTVQMRLSSCNLCQLGYFLSCGSPSQKVCAYVYPWSISSTCFKLGLVLTSGVQFGLTFVQGEGWESSFSQHLDNQFSQPAPLTTEAIFPLFASAEDQMIMATCSDSGSSILLQ